jgi:citrate lyase subunit beta/citryl-CoA lyase
MLSKAGGVPADELVLDLEDAVALHAKDDARAMVVDALASDFRERDVAVRVNAVGTPWCHRDMLALSGAPRLPRSIVIPKVESAADVAFVERLLDGAEGEVESLTSMRVQALIESARGLSAVHEIAASSPRLESLVLGYADLAASLGRSDAAVVDVEGWRPAREAVLVACRAHGLQVMDGPWLGVSVDAGFLEAAQRARDAGYDGKWAIHPAQVPALNRCFSATEAELLKARAVVDALDAAARDGGRGAVAVDGEMLDEAVRVRALRTLARGAAA